MRIRRATAGDRGFILGLAVRFSEFELPPWRSAQEVTKGTAAQLERALGTDDPGSEMLIACSDEGEPLGFAWMVEVGDFYGAQRVAKLSEIAVVRDGEGAGSALLAGAEAWARGRDCDLLVLNVMNANERARKLYERNGFAPEYTMLVKPLLRDRKDPIGG